MNENLVGYLLKALDPATEGEVEDYLRANPEARQRLEKLRRTLGPLAADANGFEPPPGLWVRTLGRVAEYKCRQLPFAPAPLPSQVGGGRGRWRWPDFLVAAAVMFIATGLGLGGLNHVWHQHQIVACQNNLSRFNTALVAFSTHHNGELPALEGGKPAGMVVPMLHEAGVLANDVNLSCPTRDQPNPRRVTVDQLEALRQTNPEQYQEVVGKLIGCYAYNLGYRDENGVYHHYAIGPKAAPCDWIAVMADRPPFAEANRAWTPGNSPNHGFRGQNILFIGGHVKFITSREAGRDTDIYLNRQRQVGAGRDQEDIVLGASWAYP